MTEPTKLTPEVERRLTVWMTQYMEQHRPSGGDWYLQLAKKPSTRLPYPKARHWKMHGCSPANWAMRSMVTTSTPMRMATNRAENGVKETHRPWKYLS